MLKHLNLAFICLAISMTSFAQQQNENTLPGIQIKKKLSIEFQDGHECMTQTRAATKEEARYTTDQCRQVKYVLTKKGERFTIHQKDEKGKWYKWGTYTVMHSFSDEVNGDERLVFLCEDGSQITYVPETGAGPLVILDLITEDLIHFIFNSTDS